MKQRQELEKMGKRIWNASRTDLFLSMRFLGPALDSLDCVMDVSTGTVGTDGVSLRYHPDRIIIINNRCEENVLKMWKLYPVFGFIVVIIYDLDLKTKNILPAKETPDKAHSTYRGLCSVRESTST